jgi:O-antigen/teichoic acid export membrane protein
MIQKVMMPFMVKINDEDDKLFAFFYRGMSFSNALLLPISVFAFVFCRPIVLILLGSKWGDAVLPMQILFLSLPFRITTKVSDVLMRAKNLVYKNANRKLQYVIVLCASTFFASKWGITGIAIAVSASAVFSYVTMLLTIKRRVFQHGWEKLIIAPFKQGAIISVLTVAPAYLIYVLLMLLFNKEIIAFTVLCTLLGAFFGYAFFKKPRLLGRDFAQLQKELKNLMKNRGKKGGGGKKRRQNREQQQSGIAPDIAEITD